MPVGTMVCPSFQRVFLLSEGVEGMAGELLDEQFFPFLSATGFALWYLRK
jgi:hypothetical protein